MEKQTQVIDASVVMKWFVEEEFTDKAVEIKERYISGSLNIIVPELLFIEVINALRYKNNSEDKLIEINKSLWKMGFKVERVNEQLLNKAITVAKKYDITIYDAIYVALANLKGVFLITADSELNKVSNVLPLSKTWRNKKKIFKRRNIKHRENQYKLIKSKIILILTKLFLNK